MHLTQGIILSTLLVTVFLWATNLISKTIASFFLLAIFITFGKTPITQILTFPLSENFILIVFSFIFSQGIANSKLADKLIQPFLFRYANSLFKFFFILFILQTLMIFIIPQPISRIIIIVMVFLDYFERIGLHTEIKGIMVFWIYVSSAFINMIMIRGDIVLNNALITIANHSITEGIWIQYMMVPSLVMYVILAIGFNVRFKSSLIGFGVNNSENAFGRSKLNNIEKKHLFIIVLTVLLWAAESVHGIKATVIVVLGSLAMFAIGLLKIKDLKSVDIHLLVFLTATSSIGVVLKNSGVSDMIFLRFIHLFSDTFFIKFIIIIILTATSLHMLLGSNVTTMSVIIPGLLIIGSGLVSVEILMFIIYIAVCSHFVLPFHNVLMMIGIGNKHFTAELMLRFAPMLTGIVVFGIFTVYLNWWRIIGVL